MYSGNKICVFFAVDDVSRGSVFDRMGHCRGKKSGRRDQQVSGFKAINNKASVISMRSLPVFHDKSIFLTKSSYNI